MPAPDDILRVLTETANQAAWVAVAWHAVLGALLVAALLGWRPSVRLAGVLAAGPALSVGVAAWASGNPFNGVAFVVLAGALVIEAWRLPKAWTARRPGWPTWLGAALIAYAWVYPHFLAGHWTSYLVAAPMGLVPCPTLALLSGLVLLTGGLRSRPITATVGAWAAFYAVFGIARLGVVLDAGLLAGALGLAALLAVDVRRRHAGRRHAGAHASP